jgi:hypothetical protein
MGPYSYFYFYESLPRGYYDDPNRKWPLLIFIHGRGEAPPDPISEVLRHGVPRYINEGNQLEYTVNGVVDSFVVMAIHSDWFHPALIDKAIEYAKINYKLDTKRVYLTGLSSGSSASFIYGGYSQEVGSGYAQKLAAIAVSDGVSGGITTSWTGTTLDYCYLNNAGVPINLSYTTMGHTPSWSTGMWAIFQACPTPMHASSILNQYTSGSSAWARAFSPTNDYKTPNLYEWLLAQKRP